MIFTSEGKQEQMSIRKYVYELLYLGELLQFLKGQNSLFPVSWSSTAQTVQVTAHTCGFLCEYPIFLFLSPGK